MATMDRMEEALRREDARPPPGGRNAFASDRDLADAIVRWVDGVLERRLWPPEEIPARILARTPREILEDGHICFATPCFDLTSVTAEALRARGFDCTVVLCRVKRPLQPVALQSGIELRLDGRDHFIGFGRTSRRLQEGRYVVTGPRKAIHRRRVVGEMMDRRYLGLFGIGSYFDLPRILEGYDPRRQISRFQRMQRPGALRRARRKSMRRARRDRPGHVASPGTWQAI